MTSPHRRLGVLGAILAVGLSVLPGTTTSAATASPSRPTTVLASAPLATSPSAGTSTVAASPAAATVAARARKPRRVSTRFQLATLNILGSQHTRGSKRWAPGWKRARLVARAVKHHGIGMIGFQEVQPDQLRVLRRKLTGYSMWPRKTLGPGARRLQLAWRTNRFQLLKADSMVTPFHRQRRPLPVVLMKDRRTGVRFHVVVVHNSPRRLEAERDRATRQQLRLVNRLRRQGRTVFVIGDVNERTEFFCKARRWTQLTAPDGGTSTRRGCTPPPRPIIDYVMGAGSLRWLDYQRLRGSWVRRATDHRIVVAKVQVSRRR